MGAVALCEFDEADLVVDRYEIRLVDNTNREVILWSPLKQEDGAFSPISGVPVPPPTKVKKLEVRDD